MMRIEPMPWARAASMNSFSRIDRTCPRKGRAMYTTYTPPMIRIGIARDPLWIVIGPSLRPPIDSAVPRATPRMTTGNAQMTSMIRERMVSVTPRR